MVMSSQGPPAGPQPTPPALNVVVIGGAPDVASRLQSFRVSGANIDVDDLDVVGCSVVAVSGDEVGDGTYIPAPNDRGVVDVLVVGLGAVDHQTIADAVAVIPGKAGLDIFDVVQHIQQRAVVEFESIGRRAARSSSSTPCQRRSHRPGQSRTCWTRSSMRPSLDTFVESCRADRSAAGRDQRVAHGRRGLRFFDARCPDARCRSDARCPDARCPDEGDGDRRQHVVRHRRGLAGSTSAGFDVLWLASATVRWRGWSRFGG